MLSWAFISLLLGASTPPTCLPPSAAVDSFRMEWYCRQLAAAKEARFSAERGYRFAWIPSFDPTRVVVVRMDAGQAVVIGKVLDGRGGYVPGRLAQSTKRVLTPEEWRLLNQRMENAGLWEAPDKDDRLGLDGAEWIVEARREGEYQFRRVWSPDNQSFPQYRKACEYMLALAGIHPGDDKVY